MPDTIDCQWVPGICGEAPIVDMGAYEFQPPLPPCPADVTGDEIVDVLDLLAVLAAWGESGVPEDITGDGTVDVPDLLEILSAWGPCQAWNWYGCAAHCARRCASYCAEWVGSVTQRSCLARPTPLIVSSDLAGTRLDTATTCIRMSLEFLNRPSKISHRESNAPSPRVHLGFHAARRCVGE